MGYSTSFCAIDIARLRSTFGSNDLGLLAELDAKYGDSFPRKDQRFDTQIAEGAPTLREALVQIIEGRIEGPDWAGFQYGYATELLCEHLGEWLDDQDLIHDIEDLEIETGLSTAWGPLLPVPEPTDFPDIRFLEADVVRRDYDRLKPLDLSDEDEERESARELFRSFFDLAAGRGVGLVTFTY